MFTLSDEHTAIRDAVREFGAGEIRPIARQYDINEQYPADLLEEAAAYDFVAPNVPPRYGGAGMDVLGELIVTEELWRADPGIGGSIAAARFGTEMLLQYGDEWMCEEWLPAITSGETPIATAISEPEHGSDVGGMETTATEDPDGYVLDGTKTWISNGSVADVMIVMAKTTPDARHEGITAFLTPTDVDGLEATPIDGKLGIRASDVATIHLDGVHVPKENIIGTVDQGFYQLMEFFAPARADVAAQSVGVGQAALDAAREYAGEREQFGQAITQFQAIRHKLAEMATSVEAARALTYRAAAHIENDSDQVTQFASMAKLFASERANEVTDEAVQIFGGAGFVNDHPVERWYRDARVTKIYDGTSEIQKNVIANELL